MNAGIACHSGFCLFQPVRKKHSFISALSKNTLVAETLKGLKEIAKGSLITVKEAGRSIAQTLDVRPSYAVA